MCTSRHIVPMVLLIAAVACGGGGGGGDTDGGAVPVVTIDGPTNNFFLGQSYAFTMRASVSNGGTVTTGGTWGSDAPSVASINAASGLVQIVGLGAATIYVDYRNLRTVRRLDTTVGYQGRMDGVSRSTRCVQTGTLASVNACGEFPNGTEGTFEGSFMQLDRSVTATMSLGEGDTSGAVAAQVNDAGELRFETRHSAEGLTGSVQWSLRPSGLTQIGGTHVMRFQFAGTSGYVEITAEIEPVTIARSARRASPGDAPPIQQSLERLLQRLR